MILYSIRRISDGKFYCHFNGRGDVEWRTSPIYWKANHDEAVKKMRLFTNRTDLPVDRTRAYNYVLELEDTEREDTMPKTKLKDVAPVKAWANLSEDDPQHIWEIHWHKEHCRQDLRIVRVLISPVLPNQH